MSQNPDPLNTLLDQWKTDPAGRSLASDVWRELEHRDALSRPTRLLDRLETIFARPSFSIVFVISCVLLGLFLAEVRVAKLQSARSTALAQSYIELINPLLETEDP
jgi:hypothetical protein